MDGTGGAKRPRRPAMLDPAQAEELPGGYDPALRNEAAHTTAAALVHQGRANTDPEVVARLVSLVERGGPRRRRRPVVRQPGGQPARRALAAVRAARVGPAGPRDGRRPVPPRRRRRPGARRRRRRGRRARARRTSCAVADAVLSGVYTGDLDVALERAAAFCRVLATGAAFDADHLDDVDPSARPAADPRRRVPRAHRGGARARRVAVAGRPAGVTSPTYASGERAGPAPDRRDGGRRSPGRDGRAGVR